MRRSARVLGQDYGLTAQEMNFLLKEEGYLDGEPGNYTITERGTKYAEEQDHKRGVGGYDFYNRAWTTRTWDDGIADELDITDARKQEIRQAIAIAKRRIDESEDEGSEIDDYAYNNEYTIDDDSEALVAAICVILTAVSAYGIYRATPYIKNWWRDKALPGLKEMKNMVAGKVEGREEETQK